MKIDKIINPGGGDSGTVFCHIQYDGGKLSITGVVGPKANGDCRGSCGQIVDRLGDDVTKYAAGWDAAAVERFADVWRRWHLNDMRAGCEHQRATWDTSEPLEVVHYGLTTEAFHLRKEALEKAARAGLEGRPVVLSDTERALAVLDDWYKDRFTPPDADSPLSGCFEVRKRETVRAGWVRENEHPRGLLLKVCPVCGYKYGSAWLREEVPADVLAYLDSLPVSTITPAWI